MLPLLVPPPSRLRDLNVAAIRSEEYAAAHPEEIARRRLFFRRLLEEKEAED